jgi:hypothetical protein
LIRARLTRSSGEHTRPACAVRRLAERGFSSVTLEIARGDSPRRLLKNSRMPRCCQFSGDRKEPSAGRSRSATDKLGDTVRAEKWRHPGGKKGSHPFLGANSLGHLSASLLSYSPFRGCSFVAPPISTPKSSRVTCVSFSKSLRQKAAVSARPMPLAENLVERPDVTVFWGARASPRVVFGLLPKTVFEER